MCIESPSLTQEVDKGSINPSFPLPCHQKSTESVIRDDNIDNNDLLLSQSTVPESEQYLSENDLTCQTEKSPSHDPFSSGSSLMAVDNIPPLCFLFRGSYINFVGTLDDGIQSTSCLLFAGIKDESVQTKY